MIEGGQRISTVKNTGIGIADWLLPIAD